MSQLGGKIDLNSVFIECSLFITCFRVCLQLNLHNNAIKLKLNAVIFIYSLRLYQLINSLLNRSTSNAIETGIQEMQAKCDISKSLDKIHR